MTTLPKVGEIFTLKLTARHHEHIRTLIGRDGTIVAVHNGGAIVSVCYPGGRQIDVPATMGIRKPRAQAIQSAGEIIEQPAYSGPPRRFVIELPLPPACASPNARVDAKHKAEPIRIYRQACTLQYIAACVPLLRTPVEVSLEYFLCRRAGVISAWGGHWNAANFVYPRDLDNARAAAKAAQDALQDAGVIAHDGAQHVRIGQTVIYSKKTDHKGRTCLVLTVAEIAE